MFKKIFNKTKKVSVLKKFIKNPDDFVVTLKVKDGEIHIVIKQNEEEP